MNKHQAPRFNKRDFVVLGWTQYEVLMQRMKHPYDIVSRPRTQVYGLKKGE
jgi:hypothetical protein